MGTGAGPQAQTPASRMPPQRKDRTRPVARRVIDGILVAALAASVFGLLPRFGGWERAVVALRHARPAFVGAAVAAEAASLACYALLYRRVLASPGARVTVGLATRVTLASFLNVTTLEAQGIAPAAAADAIAVASLVSDVALIAIFGAGFAATAGKHFPETYLVLAGTAIALVAVILALVLVTGARIRASRSGRDAGLAGRRGVSGRAPITMR